jgi:hypothetical protein
MTTIEMGQIIGRKEDASIVAQNSEYRFLIMENEKNSS